MKALKAWGIRKSKQAFVKQGIAYYLDKIKNITPLAYSEIAIKKKYQKIPDILSHEEDLLNNRLSDKDSLILLEVKGKHLDTIAFAHYLEHKIMGRSKDFVFVMGGPYGFSHQVKKSAIDHISLSSQTLSHELVRLVFLEQWYRALTIIHQLPYHH